MRRIFNAHNFMISCFVLCALVVGFALGIHMGVKFGAENIESVRNEILDIKPYDASLEIYDLEYSDTSSSGFTIDFNINQTIDNLTCQWATYPSDMFYSANVSKSPINNYSYRTKIEQYPEGGTIMFRILKDNNYGSLWFYIDLPRSSDSNNILQPPYMPKELK